MWNILAISLASGVCTPIGAWIVLGFRTIWPPMLAFFLALASGVMLAVVFTELMPASIDLHGYVGFGVGMAVGILLIAAVGHLWHHRKRSAPLPLERLYRTGQSIALAIAVHDLPEGMAIGAGDMVHARLGLAIAAAIALHNLPEGMSIAAPLSAAGVSRRRILATTGLISLATPFGTAIPLMFGQLSPVFSGFILAVASGAMVYVVAHDTLPEAWLSNKAMTGVGLAVGGLLMVAISHLAQAL